MHEISEINKNIESYYDLSQPLEEKLHMIDDMADQLGEMLDWVLTIDFQIIRAPQKTDESDDKMISKLYAVSVIAGDADDEDAPVLFTTASADEALIRLQVYINLMEKLNIRNLAQSESYYEEMLSALENYYNNDCQDVLEEIVLSSFFEFNRQLSAE
ncbi:hypothetical protein [Fangia hongkongensis]|uniref:hypothetical protein n=1 Tax=Fangia hongkongensis TaxID=270495 RepID=UPI00037E9B2E|nr:hypothetical protein [Fangia hongkongensis]MBK2123719.1 hypothetical protein [Fangia hongkongensis]